MKAHGEAVTTTTLEQYLSAATRDNTRRSYAQATRHFETEWGGYLPASSEAVARYLAHYGQSLAHNTLKQRVAALGRWHVDHGFADPTRAPVVRQALRGIRALHPRREKQATPLQLQELGQIADWLERSIAAARARQDVASLLRHSRDRCLVVLGFWRGFRGDELLNLEVPDLVFDGDNGLSCYVGHSKGDRAARGTTFRVPALLRWCPVAATRQWLMESGITQGPVFRKIGPTGRLHDKALHPNSLIRLMRAVLSRAGIASPAGYSSHSLRRGFAGWATANGWDLKSLMEYVGWRDVHSAMRYIDAAPTFALPPAPGTAKSLALMSPTPATPQPIDLQLEIELKDAGTRQAAKVLRLIEERYLSVHRAIRLDRDGSRFHLTVVPPREATLEDLVRQLLDDLHRVFADHAQSAQIRVVEPSTVLLIPSS